MKRQHFLASILLSLVVAAAAGCSLINLRGQTADKGPKAVTKDGVVSGTVRDIATGAAIADAKINVGGKTATANANGVYKLVLPAGRPTLVASAGGYLTTTQRVFTKSSMVTKLDWHLTRTYGTQPIPASAMRYSIIAWNDLGMHCDQDDYSYFAILPPANHLYAQVFSLSEEEHGAAPDITVTYELPRKKNPASQTNFWTYAAKLGWDVAPNVGLTGNGTSGTMKPAGDGFTYVATAIPVTPYDDDGTLDPYGTAIITVKDANGNVLQTANVVVPAATELLCSNCHGTANPQLDILEKHDKLSNTKLVADQRAGTPHACAECHADNSLGRPGKADVENLSLAMHNFHKDKMLLSSLKPDCYNCHPGQKTQCLRGVMARAGKSCQDCHGDMKNMTATLQKGRRPWLDEPKCGDCHGELYAENANTLYRNSVLNNSPEEEMNGKVYCEACHNGTHAEYTSRNPADAAITMRFQGDDYWIWACRVCHPHSDNGDPIHVGAGNNGKDSGGRGGSADNDESD